MMNSVLNIRLFCFFVCMNVCLCDDFYDSECLILYMSFACMD